MDPILSIKEKLKSKSHIEGIDIACGSGGHGLLLQQTLRNKLNLYFIDMNTEMLNVMKKSKCIKSVADQLPFKTESLDCVFSFNSIHLFNALDFLYESSRVLKGGGLVFIYTRTRRQNSRNIWGKYFPLFNQKESRLYEINEFRKILEDTLMFKLESIKHFRYKRVSTFDELIRKVSNFHYSTFKLYSKEEFKQSLEIFKQNLKAHFKDLNNIVWYNENVLITLRHVPYSICCPYGAVDYAL